MSALEEWLPVVGMEGCYSVSNLGRVRSEKRVVMRSNGLRQTIPARMLKTPPNRRGYPECYPQRDGGGRVRLVHQLVMEAFVGPRPSGLMVCHNDGNPANPRLENLRYDTMAGNSADTIAHGRTTRGERSRNAKLTAEQVRQIRDDTRSQVQIASDYGVTASNISRIKTRDVWNHI